MIPMFIYRTLDTLFRVYEFLFIARAILSWFPMAQGNPISEMLHGVTEPVLAPIRNFLFKIPGLSSMPFDFSILVAYLLIDVLRIIVANILF